MKQTEKAKRGWWASVVFMLLICVLIIFLSYVQIQESNRDILIGIIGMLTGSISSMLSIASGRDPSEVEELKDKLSSANADREALIARLRDAQIQLQLLRQQNSEITYSIIDKLSIFANGSVIKTLAEEDVSIPEIVNIWTPDKENNDDDEEC